METYEENDTLVDLVYDIADWLPTANLDDISHYSSALPSVFFSSESKFFNELISTVRNRRTKGLEIFLNTNAAKVLSEAKVVTMLASLAQYSSASVIRNYGERYPGLRFGQVDPGVTAWARDQLRTWDSLFFLYTSHQLSEYSLMAKSLYSQRYGVEKLRKLTTEVRMVLHSLIQVLEEGNYDKKILPADLQQSIRLFLETIEVYPPNYVQTLVQPGYQDKLFSQLVQIDTTLSFLTLLPKSDEVMSDSLLVHNLWKQLSVLAQCKEMSRYEGIRLGVQHINEGDKSVAVQVQLSNTLTAGSVASGIAQQQLMEYVAQLNLSQKSLFLNELKDYVCLSPEFSAGFDVLDPDYFFKQMSHYQQLNERLSYVSSLQKYVLPEFWPLIKQLFTLIANLYS